MKQLVYAVPLVIGCATTQHYVKQQEQRQEKEELQIRSELERMTADGHFNVVAGYVHQEINQHPTQYMDELYDGADVALRHAPNGVYMLAARMYVEDMKEDMQNTSDVLEWMSDHGFSYTYDLDYDE